MNDFDSQLLIAKALPSQGGYTWTLASRLGDMLTTAQSQLGQRDPSYTILGIEFAETGPQIWFPGNRKHIVIQLGVNCLNDLVRACFQLSHECIHLLSPMGRRNATVLEEGIAVYFSLAYLRQHFSIDWSNHLPNNYAQAYSLVSILLRPDPQMIVKLRVRQAVISWITADMLMEAYPNISEDVAKAVTGTFSSLP